MRYQQYCFLGGARSCIPNEISLLTSAFMQNKDESIIKSLLETTRRVTEDMEEQIAVRLLFHVAQFQRW